MTSNRSPRASRSGRHRARHGSCRHPGSNGPEPSNVLFAALSIALLLASALVLGGLTAHPF